MERIGQGAALRSSGGRRRVAIMLAFLAILVGGCSLSTCASYRFRVTVEVDTPKGLRTGSSVMELVAEKNLLRVGDSGPTLASLKGQAVIVDLPDGPIFMLLNEPEGNNGFLGYATSLFAPNAGYGDQRLAAIAKLGSKDSVGLSVTYPPTLYTPFIKFRDISRSNTVQILDPEDFAADLGEGYALRRVTMTITQDPVTTGIDKRLPWLIPKKNDSLMGYWKSTTSATREQRLSFRNLWKGFD